jgi:hypothetical protein
MLIDLKATSGFVPTYELILTKNLNLGKLKTADDFIEELRRTTKIPNVSTSLKKDYKFKVIKDIVVDEEGSWEIMEASVFTFEDGSSIRILANDSYWWVIKISPDLIIQQTYFYYTD